MNLNINSSSKNRGVNISILMLIIMIFFGYLIGNLNILLYIATILLIVSTFKLPLTLSIENYLWLMAGGFCTITLIYTNDIEDSLKFIVMLFCFILFKLILENQWNWQILCLNILWKFSLYHVFMTFLQFLNGSLFYQTFGKLIPGSVIQDNINFYNLGNYAGITGQVSVNSFYIVTCIGITFSKIINKISNKYINIAVLVLSIFSLFLTAKRSALIISIVCITFILVIFGKIDREKFIKIVFIIIFILLSVWIILVNIEESRIMIEKFIIMSNKNDMTNGRLELWKNSLQLFNDRIVWGVGIAAIPSIIHEMSHNIYVQLLGEIGIIGTLIFVTAFLTSLFYTIKSFLKYSLYTRKNNFSAHCFTVSIFIQLYFLFYGFSGNPLYGHMFLGLYILSISIGVSQKKVNINSIKRCDIK